MFAKDLIERFIVMCTFSDGKKPLCIAAIEEAKFKIDKFCKFNNSAAFERMDPEAKEVDRTTLTFF